MKRTVLAGLSALALFPVQTVAQDVPHSIDTIVVQTVPWQTRSDGLTQSVSVLEGDVLDTRLEGTIGETLSGLPGISSTFFGPGASRPIIRGQSGDRVRILVGGISSIDASTVSPDHAVAGESLSVERIEVIRGASTLLYGPNAIGGVVNILDGRIPTAMPEGGWDAMARAQYGTGADERSITASVTAAASKELAVHFDGFHRQSGDYRVPRDAHEEGERRVENSSVKARGGNAGISWIGDNGFLGVSVSVNNSKYGVPGEGHHHDEHDDDHGDDHDDHDDDDHDDDHHGDEDDHDEEGEEELVRIDLDQNRFDLMGGFDADFLIFQQVKLRFGWADYEHVELEGEEIGTIFANKGWEGRLDFVQKDTGNWSGGMGFQLKRRDFAAIGEEAFTPPSVTEQWGVFAAEEVSIGDVLLQAGLRFDQTRVNLKQATEQKKFDQFSLALGGIWSVTDTVDLTLNLSRTERSPTAEELFSDGAHLATQTFELGDPTLGKETALSAELGVRVGADDFHLEAYAYYTRYQDYIYQADTGLMEDDLTVRQYSAADATFTGFEVEAAYDLSSAWSVRAQVDLVHAKLRHRDEYLPRIPPFSFSGGLDYSQPQWDAGAELVVAGSQKRVAGFETQTPGHTFVNAYIHWRPFPNNPDISMALRAKNLFNSAGINHSSFIKREAPLPGRDVRLSIRVGF